MKPLADPYRALIQRFNRHGVRYVVVGMAGINYYARNPAETFATLDYDVFLEPTRLNVEKALRGLASLGFSVGTAEGVLKPGRLDDVVGHRRTLSATTTDGLMVELLLEISGYTFAELAEDAVTISIRGVPVRVGTLQKLLRSKQVAGRAKDRQFLKRYEALLTQERRRSSSSTIR